MCCRYGILGKPGEELDEILALLNRKNWGREVKTHGEMRPADFVPVIARSQKRERSVFPMQWGFLHPDGKRIINARSETAAVKPLFRDGMRFRRCLVPANEYYEWEKRDGQKIKYAISIPDEPVMYLAGIYRAGQAGYELCVLTRPPVPQIQFIHDRMPVLFSRETAGFWLDPDLDASESLPRAMQSVAFRPVSDDSGGPVQQRIEF